MQLESIEDELEDARFKEETVVTAVGRIAGTIDEDDFRLDVRTLPAYCSHLLSVYAERALPTVLDLDEG